MREGMLKSSLVHINTDCSAENITTMRHSITQKTLTLADIGSNNMEMLPHNFHIFPYNSELAQSELRISLPSKDCKSQEEPEDTPKIDLRAQSCAHGKCLLKKTG